MSINKVRFCSGGKIFEKPAISQGQEIYVDGCCVKVAEPKAKLMFLDPEHIIDRKVKQQQLHLQIIMTDYAKEMPLEGTLKVDGGTIIGDKLQELERNGDVRYYKFVLKQKREQMFVMKCIIAEPKVNVKAYLKDIPCISAKKSIIRRNIRNTEKYTANAFSRGDLNVLKGKINTYKLEREIMQEGGQAYCCLAEAEGKKYFMKVMNPDFAYNRQGNSTEQNSNWTFGEEQDYACNRQENNTEQNSNWTFGEEQNYIESSAPCPSTSAEKTLQDLIFRFNQEGSLLTNFDHPNIVRGIEYFTIGELRVTVMEFLNGKNLCQILTPKDEESMKQGLKFFLEIVQALCHTHRFGVFHHDLKPDNLIVHSQQNGQERAILLDFGIARSKIDFTEKDITGAYRYFAPEYLRGQDYSRHSELFVLGVVFYEFLTGKHPFIEEENEAMTYTIMKATLDKNCYGITKLKEFQQIKEKIEQLRLDKNLADNNVIDIHKDHYLNLEQQERKLITLQKDEQYPKKELNAGLETVRKQLSATQSYICSSVEKRKKEIDNKIALLEKVKMNCWQSMQDYKYFTWKEKKIGDGYQIPNPQKYNPTIPEKVSNLLSQMLIQNYKERNILLSTISEELFACIKKIDEDEEEEREDFIKGKMKILGPAGEWLTTNKSYSDSVFDCGNYIVKLAHNNLYDNHFAKIQKEGYIRFKTQNEVLQLIESDHKPRVVFTRYHPELTYLVMEKLPGEPLSNIIEKLYDSVTNTYNSPNSPNHISQITFCSCIRDIVGVLHTMDSLQTNVIKKPTTIQRILFSNKLNKSNIGHRNIKPTSLLFDLKNQKGYVVGFGKIKDLTQNVTVRIPEENELFLAPEYINYGNYSIKSDIYSLGISFCLAMTGKNPYLYTKKFPYKVQEIPTLVGIYRQCLQEIKKGNRITSKILSIVQNKHELEMGPRVEIENIKIRHLVMEMIDLVPENRPAPNEVYEKLTTIINTF